MNRISKAIVDSIKESKWLAITYDGGTRGETSYWIFVRDVLDKKLKVDIYNHSKGDDTLDGIIYFEKIRSAQVLDFTCSSPATALMEKLSVHAADYPWLEYEQFNNNILSYLLECNRLDCDPFQDSYAMIDGIDLSVLKEKKRVPLTPEQIDQIVKLIFHNNFKNFEDCLNELTMSLLSIDNGGKKFVFVYQTVGFDPKKKTLGFVGKPKFNDSFMVEGMKHSLSAYTELDASEFAELWEKDPQEASEVLRESATARGEVVSTRPDLMIMERDIPVALGELFDLIEEKQKMGNLNVPMRAFFGDITVGDNGRKIPQIVLYDKRVNADQMMVIYKAMKNPVTYVQGPPGTGKTQTLFNVVVSSYFNGRTTLVTTMNNRPVDGIIEKLNFQTKYGEVPFPYLRLGNRDCVVEATKKIRGLLNFEAKRKPDHEKIEKIKDNTRDKNKQLLEMLTTYQTRKALNEQLEFLEKLTKLTNKKSARLEDAIRDIRERIAAEKDVKDEDILSFFSPASEDFRYLQYLFFSSIEHILKLKKDEYASLRDVVMIEDDNDRARAFNAWCKDDENMRLLTAVFPLIFTTNISANRLGTGRFLFDMVVMDEAGQCDIAKSLIPIARASSLLLVGDEDQLQPVVVLLEETNKKLKDKYRISDNYDYRTCSIITCMKGRDHVSQRVLLRHHYRCGKKIIGFSNEYFYDGKLIVETKGPDYLGFYDCKNNAKTFNRNSALEEAHAIVNFLKKKGADDTVIITPFVNQAALINSLLEKNGIKGAKAATIHSVQGGEAKTVILSSAVSPRSSSMTMKWLDEHKEIVNVAISRARENFIFFGDREAFEKKFEKESIWNQLVAYAASQGNTKVIPPMKDVVIGKSNGSMTEDEFMKTISQIVSVKGNISVRRNVPVKSVFPKDPFARTSEAEFDSVIYKKGMFGSSTALIAFEFDGGEHYEDAKRIAADKRKEELCRRVGLRLIRLPNNLAKDYEYIKLLIQQYSDDEKAAEQLSLF